MAKRGNLNFLFLGDSIVERMRGTWIGEEVDWLQDSHSVCHQILEPLGSLALGITGDGTQHLLWRLQNGELPLDLSPEVVVLLIGTNNVYLPPQFNPNGYDFSADEIAFAIRNIIEFIQENLPDSQLLVLGILPRGLEHQVDTAEKIDAVNLQLQHLVEFEGNDKLHYLDCSPVFLDNENHIDTDLMEDYLHPTPLGYQNLFEFLLPTMNNLLCGV